MLAEFINKILLFVFVLASLNTIRHLFYVIQTLVKEEVTKYTLTNKELIILGLSISYLITLIITGFTL